MTAPTPDEAAAPCVCDHRLDGQIVGSVDCPDHGGSITAIRARLAETIPGPWTVDIDTCDCGDGYGCNHAPWVHAIYTPVVLTQPPAGQEPRDYHRKASEFSELPLGTARFMAHARDDIPTLLAEYDALRVEVERARDREQAVRAAARELLDALTSEPVFTHREIAESERRTHQAVTSLRAALGPVETPQEETR
ncbi:hypothetical protein [Pseudonocardia sp.]|uniref:hypothetical protein n=1 Tax=Pseudonocardia sp. TaxID=60912 RepID=UPI003D0C6C83